MDDLARLESWAGEMLANMSPQERRRTLLAVARELRQFQIANIRSQREPDGARFAPRKVRDRRGSIRRAAKGRTGPMFKKLRLARFMKMQATADEASVGFADGSTGRIARVHHLGLRDRVTRAAGSPVTSYIRRRLLGFPTGFDDQILDRILRQLDPAG